jgi:hypothetical protein
VNREAEPQRPTAVGSGDWSGVMVIALALMFLWAFLATLTAVLADADYWTMRKELEIEQSTSEYKFQLWQQQYLLQLQQQQPKQPTNAAPPGQLPSGVKVPVKPDGLDHRSDSSSARAESPNQTLTCLYAPASLWLCEWAYVKTPNSIIQPKSAWPVLGGFCGSWKQLWPEV